ncbi:MAG: AMP-binding protein, partial [Bacteroidota bacterium]
IIAYTASYTFDISVWQMLAALVKGGQTIIYPSDLILEPASLLRKLEADGVTILEVVPSYLASLLQEEAGVSLSQIQYLLVTGEAVSQPLLAQWFAHSRFGRIPVVNAYGPTEASDDITHHIMREAPSRTNVPLGKPIQNLKIYVLDATKQLCPVGVPGEICVSGVGVGRGYLNNPSLTAEKFLQDPFQSEPTRLYCTGDLGRWLSDGTLEYLGRIDEQVKIRGYRIELGEIENVLQQSEWVSQAVVLAKADGGNTKRLVSYYVPDQQLVRVKEETLYLQQEENWHELWETEYSRTEEAGESPEEFNLTGWNDTFTGKAIPEDQMRAWLDAIVAKILAQRPQQVLELGCGAGLIYYQLVGHIQKYVGMDFSMVSVGNIQSRINKAAREYPTTILKVGGAHRVDLVADEAVDLVILNSVVQYFPGEQYLSRVLSQSIALLKKSGGGRIVLGDVRDNRLQKIFKTRLLLAKFQERAGIREFAWGVDQELLKEEELCLAPEYFFHLKTLYPDVTHVDIQLQQGDYINELTLYRYAVVVTVGIEKPVVTPTWQSWESIADKQTLITQLQNGISSLALKEVPNPRLWKEILLERGLKDPAVMTVGELAKYGEKPDSTIAGVNELLAVAKTQGYQCRLLLNEDPFKINLFIEQTPVDAFIAPAYSNKPLSSHVATSNVPLYGDICELFGQDIRQYLQKRLPEYMVPGDLIALAALPLTRNNKIDRKFLSLREDMQRKSRINYQAPVTMVEQQLVTIWQELLGLERIGIYDNFFELGGHSLLATRVVSAIRKVLEVELTVKDFFLYPTIARLALYLRVQDKGLLLPAIEVEPRPELIPLSFSQERLWFVDQLEGSVQYHM